MQTAEKNGVYQTESYGGPITSHKNTSAPVQRFWQDRSVFIFSLLANSLIAARLPDSLSQIQVGLEAGCSQGCQSSGKETTNFRETIEPAPSILQTAQRA